MTRLRPERGGPGCTPQPQPLHELGERLAHQRLEHPVKVEGGGGERGTGHRLQAQGLGKVAHDVVDRPVDPIDVRDRCGCSLESASSQDLANPLSDRRVS